MAYVPFEDERLEFSKQIFEDDVHEEFRNFLSHCSITSNVRTKLLSMYSIHCSQDSVLTTLSDPQIDYKLKELDLSLMELKMSFSGMDTLTALSPDFENACQILKSRVAARYSRSYNGFERLCTISTYTTHNETKRETQIFEQNQSERRGLLRG